jgi:hypothetical protein
MESAQSKLEKAPSMDEAGAKEEEEEEDKFDDSHYVPNIRSGDSKLSCMSDRDLSDYVRDYANQLVQAIDDLDDILRPMKDDDDPSLLEEFDVPSTPMPPSNDKSADLLLAVLSEESKVDNKKLLEASQKEMEGLMANKAPEPAESSFPVITPGPFMSEMRQQRQAPSPVPMSSPVTAGAPPQISFRRKTYHPLNNSKTKVSAMVRGTSTADEWGSVRHTKAEDRIPREWWVYLVALVLLLTSIGGLSIIVLFVFGAAAGGRLSNEQMLVSQLKYLSSDPSVFEDPDSPQSLAITWLAKEDESGLDLDDTDRVESRYALAVLYFATAVDDMWIDELQFLSPLHECEWISESGSGAGVGCDSEMRVVNVTIRKLHLSTLSSK